MGSIRIRLLAVGAVVAIVAVGATAVISQRIASDDVRDAVERDLELEAEVARRIEEHAFVVGSWEDLQFTVDDLADDIDERVAVTDDLGRVIADSDPGESLPAQPIARVTADFLAPGFVDPEITEELFEECAIEAETAIGQIDDDVFEECLGSELEDIEELVSLSALVFLGDESRTTASVLGGDGLDGRLVAVAAIVVVGALALAAVTALPLLAPIAGLRRAAAQLGEGDLTTRAPERGATELADLARSFNSMADSLERDDEQRRQWTSDVAHELRSPLQNLRGHVESAQDGLMDVDDEWYDSVLDEVGHLTHLVEDLQTLTLADSDRLALDRRPVDLGDLADDVVRAHAARAAAAGVALDAAGAATADVDERRMRQVLGNLLDNAIRHTPSGGSVEVRVADRDEGATICVVDSGEGIPADQVDVVLDRFRRADAARSRTTGGTGLGLAIVQSLVEAHGGAIELRSEVGVGTTVEIRLPVAAAAE